MPSLVDDERDGTFSSRTLLWSAWLAAAVMPTFCAFMAQWLLQPQAREYPFVPFFSAIVVSSWLGGRSGGLAATALSTLTVWLVFVPPTWSFYVEDPAFFVILAIFLATGAGISHLHQGVREGVSSVSQANQQLEIRDAQRVHQLADSLQTSQASQARLEGIVDSAMDAIISVDKEQRILLFNTAAEALFGIKAGDVMGQSIERFIPVEARKAHGQYVAGFGKTGVTSRSMRSLGALKAVRCDGVEFPIEASISKVEVGGQQVFTVILRDISERQQSLQAIQEREQRLEAVIENLTEGLILTAADGQMLHWNKSAMRLHEFTEPEEWERRAGSFPDTFELLTLEGQVVPFRDWPISRILAGESVRDLSYRVRRRDVDWERVFSYGGTLLDDPAGQPISLLSVTDITERHQAEQAVRESDDRLQAVTENLTEGLVLARLDGQLLHWNRAGVQMFGYDNLRECLRALPDFADTFRLSTLTGEELPPDRWPLARVLSGEQLCDLELRIQRHDSSLDRIFSYSGSIIHDATGRPLAFVAIDDVTEERLAQDKVHRLNSELEQRVVERTVQLQTANKELEAFSYSVSHDLRAPLRAIDGFSLAMIEDYGASLPDDGLRYLNIIRDGAQRMGRLIDDLLSFSRLSRSPLNKERVDADRLVRLTIEELSEQLRGRELAFKVGEMLPCWGDAALLRQVWMNLVANAVKYTGQRERALVEIGSRRGEGEVVYFVQDNGTGFDMRYADKLFGVFQRLHRVDEFEGTGVGLAIVERIVHRHAGRVWAEAELGSGATFFFSIKDEEAA